MENKIITYRNTGISYQTAGEGTPVVLLHGFAEDSNVWCFQLDFLKDNFYLIIPDIPGSGLSPFNNSLISIEDYAAAIKAILDSEKITGCVMIGHSMGGYITLAFAEKYPQLLKAMGLFHSTAFEDTEEKKQARLKSIEFIKENGVNAFIKTSTPGLFSEDFKTKNPQMIEALLERNKKFSSASLIQYYAAMIARPDRTEVLKNFSKPVLFIAGEKDNIIPLSTSLQQVYLPSQSHIFFLKNSVHMGMWEEPEKSNNILIDFLLLLK